MDDVTRELLEQSKKRLTEYRDCCEDDGCVALVKPVDKLIADIQSKLEEPFRRIKPEHLISLVDGRGKYQTFEKLQAIIYQRLLDQSESVTVAAAHLKIARSTMYKQIDRLKLKIPQSKLRPRR